MRYYLGVDAHKKYSVVAVATEDGTFKTIVRIENTVEEVHKLFTSSENNSTYQVVLEAGINWGVVYDLFGRLGRRFLESVVLPAEESLLLKQHLQLLQYVESLLKDLREVIKDDLFQDERVRLLQTIPGIGDVFAPLIALEIDDINRFKSYRHFWSYCGLVPSIYASGGRIYHGHLIKGCNKWLKWVFIEAVYPATRSSPYLGFYYEKKSRLKGKATAAIAFSFHFVSGRIFSN